MVKLRMVCSCLFLLYHHDGDSEKRAVTQCCDTTCSALEDPLLLSTLCPALLTMTIFTAWGAGRWFRLVTKWDKVRKLRIKNHQKSRDQLPQLGFLFPFELFWIILKVIGKCRFCPWCSHRWLPWLASVSPWPGAVQHFGIVPRSLEGLPGVVFGCFVCQTQRDRLWLWKKYGTSLDITWHLLTSVRKWGNSMNFHEFTLNFMTIFIGNWMNVQTMLDREMLASRRVVNTFNLKAVRWTDFSDLGRCTSQAFFLASLSLECGGAMLSANISDFSLRLQRERLDSARDSGQGSGSFGALRSRCWCDKPASTLAEKMQQVDARTSQVFSPFCWCSHSWASAKGQKVRPMTGCLRFWKISIPPAWSRFFWPHFVGLCDYVHASLAVWALPQTQIDTNRHTSYISYVRKDMIWYDDMAVCQNLVPLVNIKIAGKWMFIPLKMILIGIDPYPYRLYCMDLRLRRHQPSLLSQAASADPPASRSWIFCGIVPSGYD